MSKITRRNNPFPWFTTLALLLLLAGYAAGLIWPHHFQEALVPAISKLKKSAQGIESESAWQAIWTIFMNNAIASLELMAFGIAAGLFPALMLWMNGVLLGYATALAIQHSHAPLWQVMVYAVLPHGVFELTGVVWASVLGFQLGFAAIHSVLRRLRPTSSRSVQPQLSLRQEGRRAVRHLPWILVLLFIAACIEATVTPQLVHYAHL
jgi:stage II sporulation protein M